MASSWVAEEGLVVFYPNYPEVLGSPISLKLDEHMVGRAVEASLKELKETHSLEMLRTQTGRTQEKDWQGHRLQMKNKRWRAF